MARSKYTIWNQALSASGQPGKEIQPGSTGNEAALLERWYPEIVDEAFEAGDYHFGRSDLDLDTRSDGEFGFDDAWLIPDDVLHVDHVRVNDRRYYGDWERNGSYLYINASSDVSIVCVRAGSESGWSAAFAYGIVLKLEAILRRGINEEIEESELIDEKGEFALSKAGMRSAKQKAARRPHRKGFVMRSRLYGRQRLYRRGHN